MKGFVERRLFVRFTGLYFRYAFTNIPVIIRNIASKWPAMSQLDYNWLKSQYTQSPDILEFEAPNCFFRCYKTEEFKTLSDVFGISDDRLGDVVTMPWYVGWSVCQPQVYHNLSQLITLPQFLSGSMVVYI